MLTSLDVLNSTLASTLRFWRGTYARQSKPPPGHAV
jgi:hypothetical protein